MHSQFSVVFQSPCLFESQSKVRSYSDICEYAHHNGHDLTLRRDFFHSMNNHVRSVSVHGPKLIYGDLNARLHFRTATEHSVIGQHVFGDSSSSLSASNNRNLLMEVCNRLNCCIANTFFQLSPESTVIYWGIGSTPLANITTRAFAQFDVCIAQLDW